MSIKVKNTETGDSTFDSMSYYFATFNMIDGVVFVSDTEMYFTGIESKNFAKDNGELILHNKINSHSEVFKS